MTHTSVMQSIPHLAAEIVIAMGSRPVVFVVVYLVALFALLFFAQRFVVYQSPVQRMSESTRRRLARDRGDEIEAEDRARMTAIGRVEARS